MSNWFEALPSLHGQVWATLREGAGNPAHPAYLPTLSTISATNWPEARTVVLRSADADQGMVTIHTDLYSDKVRSLTANPRAALHFWDAERALQVRLQANVTIQSGPDVRALWEATPNHSQQSYGVTPAPGQPIPDALEYVKVPDPATFAVMQCEVIYIDAVHLGVNHRRASYSRSDDWAGQWLSP